MIRSRMLGVGSFGRFVKGNGIYLYGVLPCAQGLLKLSGAAHIGQVEGIYELIGDMR